MGLSVNGEWRDQWSDTKSTSGRFVPMDHLKAHYYRSHPSIDPTGVVPVGPEIDLSQPHEREELEAA